jgi:hypothetical protein
MASFGKALGIGIEVTDLPTEISGLTHTFRPGIQWFGNAKERIGFSTAYDAVEGFDRYIEGVADVIHHTEDIQKLRALAGQMRYNSTEEPIKKRVDEIQGRKDLSPVEKETLIQEEYGSKFAMSHFVAELDEYTNLLANKKSLRDRVSEARFQRKFYNVFKTVRNRLAPNMVAINVGTWAKNLIPLAHATGVIGQADLLRGMAATIRDRLTPINN